MEAFMRWGTRIRLVLAILVLLSWGAIQLLRHSGALPAVRQPGPTAVRASHPAENDVESLAFSPDSRWLAAANYDSSVELWDTARRTLSQHLIGARGVNAVAWAPDGRRLAAGYGDGQVLLWDPASGRVISRLAGASAAVFAVAFAPDGQTLAAGSADHTVRLWDVASGTLRGTLIGHTDSVSTVSWAPDGRRLASGSADQTVRLWDVASGQEVRNLGAQGGDVLSVAFRPDGQSLVATGDGDGFAGRLWNLRTGQIASVFNYWGSRAGMGPLALAPGGGLMLTAGGRRVQLWDLPSGLPVKNWQWPDDDHSTIRSVAFAPDGTTIAAGLLAREPAVRFWNLGTLPGAERNTTAPTPSATLADLALLAQAFTTTLQLRSVHFAETTQGFLAPYPEALEGDYLAPDRWYARGTYSGASGEFLKLHTDTYRRAVAGPWAVWDDPGEAPPHPPQAKWQATVARWLNLVVVADLHVAQDSLAGHAVLRYAGPVDSRQLYLPDLPGALDYDGLRSAPPAGMITLWVDPQTRQLLRVVLNLDLAPAWAAYVATAQPAGFVDSLATPTSQTASSNWTLSRQNDPAIAIPPGTGSPVPAGPGATPPAP
jgi:dipeptidyl aminopeptidase/acylaminoacyl peptidase